jgi:hypothetical protein
MVSPWLYQAVEVHAAFLSVKEYDKSRFPNYIDQSEILEKLKDSEQTFWDQCGWNPWNIEDPGGEIQTKEDLHGVSFDQFQEANARDTAIVFLRAFAAIVPGNSASGQSIPRLGILAGEGAGPLSEIDVPFQSILDQLQSLNVEHVILFADIADLAPTAHEGVESHEMVRLAIEALQESNKSKRGGQPPRIWMVLSADDQEVSWSSWIQKKSLFQTACLESLKKKRRGTDDLGRLNLRDFFLDVQRFVQVQSDGYQNPVLISPEGRRNELDGASQVTVAQGKEGVTSWITGWFGTAKTAKEPGDKEKEDEVRDSKTAKEKSIQEKDESPAADGTRAPNASAVWKPLELEELNPWEWSRELRSFSNSKAGDLKQLANAESWKDQQRQFRKLKEGEIWTRDDWKMWEDSQSVKLRSALGDAIELIQQVAWWRDLLSLYPHQPGSYDLMKSDYESYLNGVQKLREVLGGGDLWKVDLDELTQEIASVKESRERCKKKLRDLCRATEGEKHPWLLERQLQLLLVSPLLAEEDRKDLGLRLPKTESEAPYLSIDDQYQIQDRSKSERPWSRHEELLKESLKGLPNSPQTPFERWLLAVLSTREPEDEKLEWMYPVDPSGLHFKKISLIDLEGKDIGSRELELLRNLGGKPLDRCKVQLDSDSSQELIVKLDGRVLRANEAQLLESISGGSWRLEVIKKDPKKELLGTEKVVLKAWDLEDMSRSTDLRVEVQENTERLDLIVTQKDQEVEDLTVPSLMGSKREFRIELENKRDRERRAVVSVYRVPAQGNESPERELLATSPTVVLPIYGKQIVPWAAQKVEYNWDAKDSNLLFKVEEYPGDSTGSKESEATATKPKPIAFWEKRYAIRAVRRDLPIQAKKENEKGKSFDFVLYMEKEEFEKFQNETSASSLSFKIREVNDGLRDEREERVFGEGIFKSGSLSSDPYPFSKNDRTTKKRWMLDLGGYKDDRQFGLGRDGESKIDLEQISEGKADFAKLLLIPPKTSEPAQASEPKNVVPIDGVVYLPSESGKIRKRDLGVFRIGAYLRIPLNHRVQVKANKSGSGQWARHWELSERVDEVSHFPTLDFMDTGEIQLAFQLQEQRFFDIPVNQELDEGRYDVTLELRKQSLVQYQISQSFFYDTRPPLALTPPSEAKRISKEEPLVLKPKDEGDVSEASGIDRWTSFSQKLDRGSEIQKNPIFA